MCTVDRKPERLSERIAVSVIQCHNLRHFGVLFRHSTHEIDLSTSFRILMCFFCEELIEERLHTERNN